MKYSFRRSFLKHCVNLRNIDVFSGVKIGVYNKK